MDEDPVANEDEFWDELEDIVSTPCRSFERIDDTLRTWLDFIATNKDTHVATEQAVLRVSYALLSSSLFSKNEDYIRRQITYALLQEEEPLYLHLATAFLLLDGRQNELTFELMSHEGAFAHLVKLIREGVDDSLGLHGQLFELIYEMSRIQQVPRQHLSAVDDDFVLHLFQLIEGHSDELSDPYHYPVIRVLLVLNEQYMVATSGPASNTPGGGVTNRVVKTISLHGHNYKTFGENIILLLNRETETSLQFLILKLLYLLFTTPSTQEYFYTNDLYVLIDILIRNILDLPPSSSIGEASRTDSLRHTYLRVLHPLVAHTQLRLPPHYKQDELRRTLHILAEAGTHFEHPDETTLRLVGRCLTVPWLEEPKADLPASAETAVAVADSSAPDATDEADLPAGPSDEAADLPPIPTIEVPSHSPSPEASPVEPDLPSEPQPRKQPNGKPIVPTSRRLARRKLGLQSDDAAGSSLSVQEVAGATEKPGVQTPSRHGIRPLPLDADSHGSALSVQEVANATEKPGLQTPSRSRRGPQPPLPPPVPLQRRGRKKSPFEDNQ